MNDWWLRGQYGYGVARLRLPASPPRPPDLGLVRGFYEQLRGLSPADRRRWIRHAMTTTAFRASPVVLLCLFWFLIPTFEVELFEPTQMAWIAEEPPPVVAIQELAPKPPSNERVAEVEEPPPVVAIPEPVPKPPPVEQVAEEEEPPPTPIQIAPQRGRLRSQLVVMDPIVRLPPRVSIPAQSRVGIRPARSTRGSPRPELTPAALNLALAPARSPAAFRAPRIPAISLDAGGFPPGDSTLPSVSAPRPAFPGPRLESGTGANALTPTQLPPIERPSFSLEANSSRAIRGVASVPLSSLPSCRSDAEEESLKRDVLETVEVQVECNSEAGIWSFLQTRNLNAFLMNVKRDPGRPHGNRCDELRLALACLRAAQSEEIER
jgi:hypothetical protein